MTEELTNKKMLEEVKNLLEELKEAGIRRDHTIYVFTVESKNYPHKILGYRWEMHSRDYKSGSKNLLITKCNALTSASNFAVKHKFGIKTILHDAGTERHEMK